MRYYHGTDYESALSIMKNGFKSENRIWTCSYPSHTYLVCDNDDEYDKDSLCFAINAARMAAAHKDSKSTNIVIFAFEFDDESSEYLQPDISCANMDSYGCYQIESNELNELISTGKITCEVRFMTDAYYPHFRIFYLATGCSDYYYNPDHLIQIALDKIKNVDTCWFYDEVLWDNMPQYYEELELLYAYDLMKEAV